jgi:hypothetical protein
VVPKAGSVSKHFIKERPNATVKAIWIDEQHHFCSILPQCISGHYRHMTASTVKVHSNSHWLSFIDLGCELFPHQRLI